MEKVEESSFENRLQREAARDCEKRYEEADSPGWATASERTTPLFLKSLCGGGVPSSHPSLGCLFSFFLFFLKRKQRKRVGQEHNGLSHITSDPTTAMVRTKYGEGWRARPQKETEKVWINGAQIGEKVRPPGIEPGASAWEAEILPLNHERCV